MNSFVLLNESARICVFSMWVVDKEGLLEWKKLEAFLVCLRKVFVMFFAAFILLIQQNLISLYVHEFLWQNREHEDGE